MMRLNWRRGMLRLWLVMSIFWIAVISIMMRPDADLKSYWALKDYQPPQKITQENNSGRKCLREDGSKDWECYLFGPKSVSDDDRIVQEILKRRDDVKADLKSYVFWVLAPIIGCLVLGIILGWVGRGFMARRPDA